MARLLSALVLLGAASCAFTDPGTGSNTISVDLRLAYNTNGTGNMTAQVTVDRGTLQVSDPNVTVVDNNTNEPFTIPQGAQYIFPSTGYHRDLQIRVIAGNDVIDCNLEGPSPHVLTSPQSGPHPLSEDLQINWATPDGIRANSVVVSTAVAGTTNITDDNGWFTIPSSQLKAGAEEVTVERLTSVTPAGGTSGSNVQISYSVSLGGIQVQ